MQIYTVTEIARYLRELLELDRFLGDLWISGEVSNFSRSALSHRYFTLKDGQSQLRCVFFRRPVAEVEFGDGDAVIAHGRISFYETRGDLQFIVDLVQPEGVGLLHLKFEQLKARLQEEGLFEEARKRPLPAFPRRIGVVTSPTGAVFHDIANVVRRRYPLAELVLSPTLVQGDLAADNIVWAIQALNDLGDIDVIIAARGGGSLEELWPFNEEKVARAIYGSRVPVISGVGHETDWTIADYVADLRAPTPSAAAECAVPDVAELRRHIVACQQALAEATKTALSERRTRTFQAVLHLRRYLPELAPRRQRLDELIHVATNHLKARLALHREQALSYAGRLTSLNPLATLARGYAIVQHQDTGQVVSRAHQVQRGDAIKIQVSDGSFGGKVTRPAKGRPSEPGLQRTMAELLIGADKGAQG